MKKPQEQVVRVVVFLTVVVAVAVHVFSSLIKTYDQNEQASSKKPASGTATSGQLFRMRRTRTYDSRQLLFQSTVTKRTFQASYPASLKFDRKCRYWGALTTIFNVSEGALSLPKDWCLVVAGDRKGPINYELPPNTVFLDVEKQLQLAQFFAFVDHLPWNHFGRKNIAFLYAILNNAEWIWDFDDDNILYEAPDYVEGLRSVLHVKTENQTECGVFNPYDIVPSNAERLWPRGYPLESIRSQACKVQSASICKSIHVGIYQSLADQDPDVDAIFRLTNHLPIYFHADTDIPPILVPDNTLSPMNAQAALVQTKLAAWSLLLPVTVHGRVSDIWRSYIAQAVGRWFGLHTAFLTKTLVRQDRNAHTYLADFNAEIPLYERAGALVQFLNDWQPSHGTSLPGALEMLYVELYEHDIFELNDVILMQHWLNALYQVGYEFPAWNPTSQLAIDDDNCTPLSIKPRATTLQNQNSTGTNVPRRHYYDDVALVGQFNFNTNVDLVLHWVKRWSEFFRVVHVRGPFNQRNLLALQSVGIHVFSAADDAGWFSPMKTMAETLRLFANDTSIRGVLLSHDDLMFNLTHLESLGFPSDKDMLSEASNGIRPYLRFSNNYTVRRWDQTEFIPTANFNSPKLALRKWFWWKRVIPNFATAVAEDPRAARYANKDGTVDLYMWSQADFAYVPTAYAKDFAEMADWLVDNQVFLEAGMPTVMGYLKDRHKAAVKSAPLCTKWEKNRQDYLEWVFPCLAGSPQKPPYGFYHPIKIGLEDLRVWDIVFDRVNP